ncbi:DUF167 domain-containing protein [Candidatus Dependentiae bacterium]
MAIIFDVKVVPSSGRNKWVMHASDTLKCYLKSPPEKGLANKELIKMIAKAVGVTKSDVEIISGATSRNKKIKIFADISFDQLLDKLGLERSDRENQTSLLE